MKSNHFPEMTKIAAFSTLILYVHAQSIADTRNASEQQAGLLSNNTANMADHPCTVYMLLSDTSVNRLCFYHALIIGRTKECILFNILGTRLVQPLTSPEFDGSLCDSVVLWMRHCQELLINHASVATCV